MVTSTGVLKRGLVFFWALYLTIVLVTNFFDALQHIGVLGERWKATSSNYEAILQVMSIYSGPAFVPGLAFAGVIVWESIITVLFWRAFAAYRPGPTAQLRPVYAAFTAMVALWAAFMIADDVFIAYSFEAGHRSLLAVSLASLLTLVLLPDEGASRVR